MRLDSASDDESPTPVVRDDVKPMDLRILIPVVLVLLAVVVFLLLMWDNARRARGGKRLRKFNPFQPKGGPPREP